jgi:hypothetical protein
MAEQQNPQNELPNDVELTQQPDSPGNDENGDGLKGGQTTADNLGDVLGL